MRGSCSVAIGGGYGGCGGCGKSKAPGPAVVPVCALLRSQARPAKTAQSCIRRSHPVSPPRGETARDCRQRRVQKPRHARFFGVLAVGTGLALNTGGPQRRRPGGADARPRPLEKPWLDGRGLCSTTLRGLVRMGRVRLFEGVLGLRWWFFDCGPCGHGRGSAVAGEGTRSWRTGANAALCPAGQTGVRRGSSLASSGGPDGLERSVPERLFCEPRSRFELGPIARSGSRRSRAACPAGSRRGPWR